MKVEIDSEELKRLKSREEKYLAYMDMLSYRWEDKTYVDALCWKVAELEEENKALRENVNHRAWRCADLSEDKEELEEENKELKTKINKVIDLFNEWDSSDLYDYIDDLDYEKI